MPLGDEGLNNFSLSSVSLYSSCFLWSVLARFTLARTGGEFEGDSVGEYVGESAIKSVVVKTRYLGFFSFF